jgi:hypothetical protein
MIVKLGVTWLLAAFTAPANAAPANAAPANAPSGSSGGSHALSEPLEIVTATQESDLRGSALTVTFKDAAGSDHKAVIIVLDTGDASNGGLVNVKITSVTVDAQAVADLPAWRDFGRQLKAAKGFGVGTSTKTANFLLCVRNTEDGAPNCPFQKSQTRRHR